MTNRPRAFSARKPAGNAQLRIPGNSALVIFTVMPLDRSHPLARLSRVVADAEPAVIIVDDELAELWSDLPAQRRTVADLVALGATTPAAVLPTAVDPRHRLRHVHVRGRRAPPKGVVVPHEAVVDLLAPRPRLPAVTRRRAVTATSFAFDVSVAEIWMSLVSGGRLVVVDRDTARSPLEFAGTCMAKGVTMVNMTPSAFYQFAATLRTRDDAVLAPSLRAMILAARRWTSRAGSASRADRRAEGVEGPQLNNMYGPTETTVYVTRRGTDTRVRRGHAQHRYRPRDRRCPGPDPRQPSCVRCPAGAGDLYISGDQVTRGAEHVRINRHPVRRGSIGPAGARMYFTGDAAMYRAGSIEYLGRGDGQVKLRGFPH